MRSSIIAAIGENNELGKGNDLIWKLPADQKFFREKTLGHPIIMGRKTFESLPGILPNREHVVITRDTTYKTPTGVRVVNSLDSALEPYKNSEEEVFIIGGGEIFKQAIDKVDRLYITRIDDTEESADTYFPQIDQNKWKEVERKYHQPDEKNPLPQTFITYDS